MLPNQHKKKKTIYDNFIINPVFSIQSILIYPNNINIKYPEIP